MEPLADRIDALGVLTDPVRRSLYEGVIAAQRPLTRDEAADAVGISRSLAAYHLDKLVEAGLLRAGFAPREGGPGAGRPPKVYERTAHEVTVSLPARDDSLAADLLATAVETAGAREAALDVARRVGAEIGETTRRRANGRSRARLLAALREVLAERGYEPAAVGRSGAGPGGEPPDPDHEVVLRNCPFDHLTDRHRELVCGMNLALLEGVVEGLGLDQSAAVLDPQPGRCCVVVRR